MKTLDQGNTSNQESISENAKVKKRARKQTTNGKMSLEERIRLLNLIIKTKSYRLPAKILGISESTAKSVYYKYIRTGEIETHQGKK